MKRAMSFGLAMLFVLASVSFVDAKPGEKGGDRGPRKKGDRGEGDRKRGGHDHRRGELAEKLGLSDDQKASMKEIHETFVAAMKEARENKDREAAKAAFEARHKAVMSILDDGQAR